MWLPAPGTSYYSNKTFPASLLEIMHRASNFLPGTEELPEKEAGCPETLTLFGQRLIFSSVSFSAIAYSFTSSDTPTI